MVVEISKGNGTWFNLTPYIKFGGWKDSRNDVDGSNAGRNINGNMIRDRVAIKYRSDVSLIPIPKTLWNEIQNYLMPDEFQIRLHDEGVNVWTYRLVYSNNYSWTYLIKRVNGVEYYDNITFPLIDI